MGACASSPYDDTGVRQRRSLKRPLSRRKEQSKPAQHGPTIAQLPPKSNGIGPVHTSLSESLIRVGSKVLKDSDSGGGGLSPARASNYDHVHRAVLTNFEAIGNGDNHRVAGVVGLRNLGNTCFLNSSLQCLSNTIPLTDYFLGYDYKKEINRENFLGTKGHLVTNYAELMKEIWIGGKKKRWGRGTDGDVVEPSAFKQELQRFAPQFKGSEQHDAQELLAFLLDGIHEDLNRVKERPYIEDKDCDGNNDARDSMEAWSNYLQRNRSIVVDLFQGQLRNTMTCRNRKRRKEDNSPGCGHTNIKFDPFMYLSLPLSDESKTLDDCLANFCAEESLTGDEKWYCPKCKDHVEATKKFDIWMLPPILIIHLKRFSFSDSGTRSKIERPVYFPLRDWDLSKIKMSKEGRKCMYDLYAVAHHKGSLGFGHYYCHAMNRFDDEWYEFNDSTTSKLNQEDLGNGSSSSAYCLFYNRIERAGQAGDMTKRNPIVRRQSTDRPELWPHMQTTGDFKDFFRSTVRLSVVPEEGKEESQSSDEMAKTAL